MNQHHCQNTNSDTLRTDKGREISVTVWFKIFCVPLYHLQHEDYKHNKLVLPVLYGCETLHHIKGRKQNKGV